MVADIGGTAEVDAEGWIMFMTSDELAELTGYRQPSKQVAMLRRQGVPFHVNAAGHPKVARAIIERSSSNETHKPQKNWTPPWAVTLP